MGLWKRSITVSDNDVTSAALLTARQSLLPNLLGKSQNYPPSTGRQETPG